MSFKRVLNWFFYLILQCAMGFGIGIIVLGCLNAVDYVHDVKVSYFFRGLGIFLIVIGTTIVVLALIGILGSCLQNRCLINTFSTLMSLFVIAQMIAILAIFTFYNEETVANELKNSMQFYNKDKDIKTFWNLVNTKLECCGVDSVTDWHDNIPNSCCKDLNINDVCHKELANEKPCLPEIVHIITKILPVGFGIIGLIQVFCLIAACSMSHSKRENV